MISSIKFFKDIKVSNLDLKLKKVTLYKLLERRLIERLKKD